MLDTIVNYAVLKNGTVTDVAWGYQNTQPDALIPTGELAVQVGDVYDGKDFYRNGVKVTSKGEVNMDETAAVVSEIESLCNEIIMGV